ncbi:respiratory-chain NADH dehydrogenase subunit 1 [Thermodesulfobium narugense DSM 14796]|uniref:Respiratory-chain NADH dehydrogenase subunit 1 n=1 Tax=Thermodesulfobium narugense DSM 14796 TaxID=747365 RepID=M1E6Q0_9BACT|nr:complex I subunit 1 family protein [Thermodesulfobium narugense]AEE14273.1 respiratory-chain NADH dehydrogenase subunit 1 [Thermodesulfobium narugense DSM 14796]
MISYILSILIFPGLLFSFLLGSLMDSFRRKLKAKMQLRIGPPLTQGFYDTIKLFSKEALIPENMPWALYFIIPIVGVVSISIALSLFPIPLPFVKFNSHKIPFDLIVIFYLSEVPTICYLLFGYFTNSIFGQIGASRKAQLLFAYNVPMILIITALAFSVNGFPTFNLFDIATKGFNTTSIFLKIIFIPIFILCSLAKLKLNPFSIPNAEQEILEGPTVEASGPALALFEISHFMEWVILGFLFSYLFLPIFIIPTNLILISIILICFVFASLLSLLEAATARIELNQAINIFVKFTWPISILGLLLAFFTHV